VTRDGSQDMTPPLDFVFELSVDVGAPVELGEVPAGRRRFVPVTGGVFAGPRLSGRVMPGGGDWQVIRPDGVAELEARYMLEAADGARIGVVSRGLRHGPEKIMQRLAAGETVDPALYYFRTAFRFTPPSGRHDWLGRSIFVGLGERRVALVVLRVFVLG
jgi:hypothetical protein